MMKASYIQVRAEVRYWEDATVNGIEDEAGDLVPFKIGKHWCPVIRLDDGLLVDWPQGTTADIHYKVCDAGEYWLLDDDLDQVAKWAGFYVPDSFLCHGDTGFGDYIIFKVGADGRIEGYRKPDIEMICECKEDEQSGWKAMAPATQPADQAT